MKTDLFIEVADAFSDAEAAVVRSGVDHPLRRLHLEFIRGFRILVEAYREYARTLALLVDPDRTDECLLRLARASELCRDAQRTFERTGPGGRGLWRAVEESADGINTLTAKLLAHPSTQARSSTPASIILSLHKINLAWEARCNEPLFLFRDPRFFRELVTACRGENDYISKLTGLAGLFDQIDLDTLRRNLPTPPTQPGSINALQAVLTHWGKDGRSLVEPFRTLRTIRKQYPVHRDFPDVAEAYTRLGVRFPIDDYSAAWDTALRSFDSALKALLAELH